MGWVIALDVKQRLTYVQAITRFGILKADTMFYKKFGEGPYTDEQKITVESDVFLGDELNWERYQEQQGNNPKSREDDGFGN